MKIEIVNYNHATGNYEPLGFYLKRTCAFCSNNDPCPYCNGEKFFTCFTPEYKEIIVSTKKLEKIFLILAINKKIAMIQHKDYPIIKRRLMYVLNTSPNKYLTDKIFTLEEFQFLFKRFLDMVDFAQRYELNIGIFK